MFYENEFRISKTTDDVDNTEVKNKFTCIILSNNVNVKRKISRYSLVVAAKPLIVFASIFGSQLVQYSKNDIARTKWMSKIYNLIVLSSYVTLAFVIRPASWNYTRTDHPLNILTQTFGMFNIIEAMFSMFAISSCNSKNFVDLFNKLDDIDNHFCSSKAMFKRRRIISVLFVLMPLFLAQNTLWLTKFRIQNIGAHMTFFLVMLQGAVVCFIILSIYIKLMCLNQVLQKKVKLTISENKDLIFRDTVLDLLMNILCKESKVVQNNNLKYCWFELMQIYDKLADCLHIFHKIYCGQIFLMYNSWLLCTLLTICRSFSPSIKYSEVFLSDLFLYSCINSRPIFLAIICEMFIKQRKKTLLMLLHLLLMPGIDHAYCSQVETMIMLVVSRKLEISANVFTVNVPTVMNFAGRIISYTVLIIQYFYNYVFSN